MNSKAIGTKSQVRFFKQVQSVGIRGSWTRPASTRYRFSTFLFFTFYHSRINGRFRWCSSACLNPDHGRVRPGTVRHVRFGQCVSEYLAMGSGCCQSAEPIASSAPRNAPAGWAHPSVSALEPDPVAEVMDMCRNLCMWMYMKPNFIWHRDS